MASNPFRGAYALYLREMLILKRRIVKQIASMSVTPTLYVVAFGYGMGKDVTVEGVGYLAFLIPGLVAMNAMNHAWAIANEINIARFYLKIFEEFQAAPIHNVAYVAGEAMAGVTRALLSASVILVVALLFGVTLHCGPWFWLAVALNGFVFSTLAIAAAMLVRGHSDQNMIASFVITPMAFLSGTVFPLSSMPEWAQGALSLIPLTHAATAIRAAAFGQTPPLGSLAILALLGALFFIVAYKVVDAARN
ncbi:MAG: ABC transporter permease [Nitrospinae bacterium]|nr:ABC transporter permease [Nitrospinota bacterium]